MAAAAAVGATFALAREVAKHSDEQRLKRNLKTLRILKGAKCVRLNRNISGKSLALVPVYF